MRSVLRNDMGRHCELCWHGLHAGYDKQYNSYNVQQTRQGTSINIYGNNNYVSTNQDSTQASASSGQGLCNLTDCCGSSDILIPLFAFCKVLPIMLHVFYINVLQLFYM